MLHLLLDEHLPPAIVEHLQRRNPRIGIVSLQRWEAGAYLGVADDVLLAAAYQQQLTLVTYDRRTIAPLLKSWGEQEIPHGGIVFVNTRTFAPQNVGGLVGALAELWQALGQAEWTNRVVYLPIR